MKYVKKDNLLIFLLILLGTFSWSMVMVKSGLLRDYGIGFWGPNGHDGIWHLALINQLKSFSLNNPVFSGTKLTNYHFGFDLLVAVLSLLTKIKPIVLYFQILPPVMALLTGILTYKFVKKWLNSKKAAWWATFFVYFGGSWGWLLGKGESTFWANQSISSLINPPYTLSLIVLLLGLIKLLDYCKNPNKKNLIICAFLFGILIQIKVYAGIIALGSFGFLLLINLIFHRSKFKGFFNLFLLSLFITLILFLPFNLKASSLLVFSLLWFPRTMLSFSDRLGWFKLENARLAYLNTGKGLKWLLAEGLALAIFIFGNLGTRVLGFFYGGLLGKLKKELSQIEIFFFSSLVISLTLPLLFIQKGNPWNTIQFFYYFQFFMAIFSGVTIGRFFEKTGKVKQAILGLLVIVLTIPTTLITLKDNYLPSRPPAKISLEELAALSFLEKQPKGVVLASPFDPTQRNKFSEPKPLYIYETTAYLSAFSNQSLFLEDEMNLEITGFDWQTRKQQSLKFFSTTDQLWGKQFLAKNKIRYLYLVKDQEINLKIEDLGGEEIFKNGEVSIFGVK